MWLSFDYLSAEMPSRRTRRDSAPLTQPFQPDIATNGSGNAPLDGASGATGSNCKRVEQNPAVRVDRRVTIAVGLVVGYPYDEVQGNANVWSCPKLPRRRMHEEAPPGAVAAKAGAKPGVALSLAIGCHPGKIKRATIRPTRHHLAVVEWRHEIARRYRQHTRPIGQDGEIAQSQLECGLGAECGFLRVTISRADDRLHCADRDECCRDRPDERQQEERDQYGGPTLALDRVESQPTPRFEDGLPPESHGHHAPECDVKRHFVVGNQGVRVGGMPRSSEQ